ncbi:alpha/beta hydrolase [Streptomyces aureoverticillatus]|nr:alpha/beta hydrolase [Streptomyces aureoverticillatus]
MQQSAFRRRLVPVLALGVVAGLAPGLTAGTASAAPTAARAGAGADAERLAPYTHQKLAWKRCSADRPATFRCATLKVPLDYRKPEGKRIDVAISRVKTSVPGKRRGVLTFNPGGPGGPGLDLPLQAAEALPKAVRQQYDLIGFDPRGVGRSTPVACGLDSGEMTFPRPNRTAREFTANKNWAKKVADQCHRRMGGVLPHISTRNTARDMDVLRAVLGEKKLNYYGVSYGTALGAVYAQLFPRRVDRWVIDSAVDPKLMWRGMYRIWAPEVEPAFKRWAKWTAERSSTYHLGDSADRVTRTFWNLVKRADRKPIKMDGDEYDGAGVRDLLRPEFFSVRGGAELVVKLKKAAAGKRVSAAPEAGTPDDNGDVSHWAVVCADNSTWPRDAETYRRDLKHDSARYPLFGDFAAGISPCAYWAKGAEPVTKVNNKVPMLLVQNEWDSQTPLVGAQSMHRALKGSRMVTVDEGEGHGVLFNGPATNACAENTSMAYLATGRLPAKDVTCHATPGARKRTGAAPPAFGPGR